MALSLRKNSDGGVVGLDIDGRFLAAVTVDGGRLASVASVELPAGALADGEVADREALSAAIKDFIAENKLPRRVRLGVSNQQIVVRVLELPRIEDPSERDAALRFSAAEAIAMPLDEAVLDHQIAGYVDGEDGGERMQVVVVAARRTMIEQYLGAAKDAGLKVEGIDLDAFALVRMLAGEAPVAAAQVAPVEPPIEDSGTSESLAYGDSPTAFEPPAGDDLHTDVDALAAADAGSPQDALAPSREAVPAPPQPAAVEPPLPSARVICHLGGVSNLAIAVGSSCFFTRTLSTAYGADAAGARLAEEIRLSIDYYMAQPKALPVTDVLVSGEGACDQALVAEIGAQLGLPVGAAAPLGALDASGVLTDDPYRYTVAAGLALGEAA